MTLSLKQVRYFIATADAGQVSQAAIELNVSQSAVTAAIKQLEEDTGVSLFKRLPSGVSLTAEGARFLQHARNIMAAVNAAQHAPLTEDTAISGTVRIGVSYTVAGYFLPRHYTRFARSYPRIRAELYELPRNAIEGGLKDGSLDLAVMLVSNLQDRKRLAYETLIRSRRRLWLPVEHRLLAAETITLEDVAAEPYVMLTVDEAHQTAGRYWKSTDSGPASFSPPPRSRRCVPWWPMVWASPYCPTWSTVPGRWKVNASSYATSWRISPPWTSASPGILQARKAPPPARSTSS